MKERDYIIIMVGLTLIILTACCVISLASSYDRQLGLATAAAIFGYGAYTCAKALRDNPEK